MSAAGTESFYSLLFFLLSWLFIVLRFQDLALYIYIYFFFFFFDAENIWKGREKKFIPVKRIGRQQAGGWGHWESLVLDQKQGSHAYVAPSHPCVPLKPPRPQPGQRDVLLWSPIPPRVSYETHRVTNGDRRPRRGPPAQQSERCWAGRCGDATDSAADIPSADPAGKGTEKDTVSLNVRGKRELSRF